MLKLAPILLLTVLSAAACDRSASSPPSTPLSRAEFVAVMAELSTAEPQQRPAILKKHRTSDAELRAYIKALAAHPTEMSSTFDSLQAALDRNRLQEQ